MPAYQCPACNEQFRSLGGFEMHRVGRTDDNPPDYGRRCLSEQEMRIKGMKRNERGQWGMPLKDPEGFKRWIRK